MNNERAELDARPTMLTGCIGLVTAAVLISLPIGLLLGLQMWPLVLIVTASIVCVIGTPLFV